MGIAPGGRCRPSRFSRSLGVGTGQEIGSLLEKHEFAEAGNVTTMCITQTYASNAARDGAMASGMDEGMEACYQELDTVLM